jgi:hypothetical protein
MSLQPVYPVRNAERLKNHFEEFTSIRMVSFNQPTLRANIVFINSIGFCVLLISSEDDFSLPHVTADTLISAIIIFITFAPNHFRQRRIVDSSAATVISVLPRLIASSMESVLYRLYGVIMSGSSLWYFVRQDSLTHFKILMLYFLFAPLLSFNGRITRL